MKKRGPSKAETERKYGSREFREWIHSLPCQLCGVVGFTQQAHVGKHPMGKKLDWTHTTALCGPLPGARMGCHQKFDERKLTDTQRKIVNLSVIGVHLAWLKESA